MSASEREGKPLESYETVVDIRIIDMIQCLVIGDIVRVWIGLMKRWRLESWESVPV